MENIKKISSVDSAASAWNRMLQILFRPFCLTKWLVIGFCAWLANMGQWSGSANFKIPDFSKKNSSEFSNLLNGNQNIAQYFDFQKLHDIFMEFVRSNVFTGFFLGLGLIILVMIILAVIVICLVMSWLRANGDFLFIYNLARNSSEIVTPWKEYTAQAFSLFIWRVLLSAVAILLVIILAGVTVIFCLPSIHSGKLMPAGIISLCMGGLLIITVLSAVFIFSFFVDSFVVPIMYKKRTGFIAALFIFSRLFFLNFFAFLRYCIVYFMLNLVFITGFAALLMCLCCCCCCIFILFSFPYVWAVILLPVLSFFRLYSIEFLSCFGEEFDVFVSFAGQKN